MPKKIATISVDFARAMLAPAQERGADIEELLAQAGIELAELQTSSTRVPIKQVATIVREAMRFLDDEFLGQDSRHIKLGSTELLCRSLVHCATLDLALHQMARFINILFDDIVCCVELRGDSVRFLIGNASDRKPCSVLGQELWLFSTYGILCWLVGRRLPLVAAEFGFARLERCADYAALLSTPIDFDRPRTALLFEQSFLALPVVQNEQMIAGFLNGMPYLAGLKYRNVSGFSSRIRRALRAAAEAPQPEWPDFDEFAAHMHMSRATLHRRMEKEGQSYQAIKDQLRRDMAVEYLEQTEHSTADIAYKLGFAEPSAFYRAFKKWAGMTPLAYRKRASR